MRSLDVRQARWIGRFEELEPLPAHKPKMQVANELLMMLLADSEEIHDLTVQVIDDLDFGRLLVKQHLRSACKGLYIGGVLREYLNHPIGQPVLSLLYI